MSSSISPFSLYAFAFSFFLLVQIAISTDHPLFHFCSTSEQNFTTNSIYDQNLNKLLGDLYFKTPPTGYGQSSLGQYQSRVHGFSLCRGDISTNECKTCVTNASSEIRKLCPNDKGATIWYDHCLLKYSGVDFFGQIDNHVRYSLLNVNNVSNPESFNAKVKGLLGSLSERASVGSKMYAGGECELVGDSNKKIYGMVQCTRDLTSADCKTCLDDAIKALPSCCDGKQGGRVVGESCNIGYEIYPFLSS